MIGITRLQGNHKITKKITIEGKEEKVQKKLHALHEITREYIKAKQETKVLKGDLLILKGKLSKSTDENKIQELIQKKESLLKAKLSELSIFMNAIKISIRN